MSMLIIPNENTYLPMLQSFVFHSAKLINSDKEFLSKLELVCEEAFVQVIKNSFEEGEISTVKVETKIENSRFILSFFDKGLPFDASLSKEYKVEDYSAVGLELFLIKKYSDSVDWVNHGASGKEFRITFEIPSVDIFTITKNEKIKTTQEKPKSQDLEIRDFKDSDAIKISRIIYRAYGYTYPNEDMYYPQKILDLNNSKELVSIVSFDKNKDEVVGHYALEIPVSSQIAESGQAVVSPTCRGLGLMKKMRVVLENRAKELNLEGIMSQPVTSHTFSQQVNEGFGSSACGFSYGLVPKKLSFKQINQTLSQRESCMLYFKALKKRDRVLNIPKNHKKIIDIVYKNIGLDYKIAKNKKIKKEGVITSGFASGWGIGTINVEKIAKDSFKRIREAFNNLLLNFKADVIFLNITLEDSDTDELIEKIESEKFFFAGIYPSLLKGKDAIRFEYLNGLIDDSKIQIYSKEAKEIFGYISHEREKVLL